MLLQTFNPPQNIWQSDQSLGSRRYVDKHDKSTNHFHLKEGEGIRRMFLIRETWPNTLCLAFRISGPSQVPCLSLPISFYAAFVPAIQRKLRKILKSNFAFLFVLSLASIVVPSCPDPSMSPGSFDTKNPMMYQRYDSRKISETYAAPVYSVRIYKL